MGVQPVVVESFAQIVLGNSVATREIHLLATEIRICE